QMPGTSNGFLSGVGYVSSGPSGSNTSTQYIPPKGPTNAVAKYSGSAYQVPGSFPVQVPLQSYQATSSTVPSFAKQVDNSNDAVNDASSTDSSRKRRKQPDEMDVQDAKKAKKSPDGTSVSSGNGLDSFGLVNQVSRSMDSSATSSTPSNNQGALKLVIKGS